jgi:hypothetical protein
MSGRWAHRKRASRSAVQRVALHTGDHMGIRLEKPLGHSRLPRRFSRLALALGILHRGLRHPDSNPMPAFSPEAPHAIAAERDFIADDGQIFCLGLSDEHAIERILQRAGQKPGPNPMIACDGQ